MEQITKPRFLAAEWRDLLFLSYQVDPKVLTPYLPRGVEPDLFQGSAVVSLVAFRFLNARFFGVRPAFIHSFAELNLRYYAKHTESGQCGVVFIREICPYLPVGLTARLFFNERFIIRPCRFEAEEGRISYTFGSKGGQHLGNLVARIAPQSSLPEPGTFSHFVTDRYHGFGRFHGGATIHFEAGHTPWVVSEATLDTCALDTHELCSGELAEVLRASPSSALYAPGSPIELSWGSLLPETLPLRSPICPAQNHGS